MSSKFKIAIDCDDAAIDLKNVIFEYVKSKGENIVDLKFSEKNNGAMYPDIGFNLANKIKDGEYDRGILICGTGLGMCMIANKVEGVYAGVCHDVYSAERLCKSNNAQIITMGARVIGSELAKTVIDAWLNSEFDEVKSKRSIPKVNEMHMLEKRSFSREA